MKPPFWLKGLFASSLVLLLTVTSFAPLEYTLGEKIRLVYLHGVWVWAGLGSFAAAALSGIIGLIFRSKKWHRWSRAFGWTAMAVWLTYLPMSLLVMQMNWGGLYFDEPRWRIPFTFAVTGVLLQAGLWLLGKPPVTSLANCLFAAALFLGLFGAENVMHPDSPVFNSPSVNIRLYFGILLVLAYLSAGFLAAIFYRLDGKTA
jgi:hypothetical protein